MDDAWAPKSREAWNFVRQMLGDITETVLADAESQREVLEGLRVVSRVTALCSELSVEADPELPWFFDMCSPTRLVGGPNPDGGYYLAMIRGTAPAASPAPAAPPRTWGSRSWRAPA
jgi:hypothetical protein